MSTAVTDLKTVYKVKAKEEELGNDYLEVTVPSYVTREGVLEVFKMAEKYISSGLDSDANENEFDSHFKEMQEVWEDMNGLELFMYYITTFHHWECSYMELDFEFQW